MKLSASLLAAMATITAAVDMDLYQPTADVDASFKDFLQQLYAETEDPASTTSFTSFFPADDTGVLTVLANNAVGATAITALKQALMPVDGTKHWNHVPNATSVYANVADSKTYAVEGVIQTMFDGGNCSQAYYSTRFTVAKAEDGSVALTARSGSLMAYDDFVVEPSRSPTSIACQAVGAVDAVQAQVVDV